MSAPLFLLPSGDGGTALRELGAGAVLVLDGEEGRHAADVARVRPGERILVGDGVGTVADAVVVAGAPGRVEAEVREVVHHPVREPRLILVQALAKGERDLMAVEAATELGVDEIVPWQATRSVSVWAGASKQARGRARWTARSTAAAKQSRRPHLPTVHPWHDTAQVATLVRDADVALLLHETADTPLAAATLPATGRVVVVVGPEGGVAEPELAELGRAGALVVRLGPEVLRTSTAGPAALAVLSARLRW